MKLLTDVTWVDLRVLLPSPVHKAIKDDDVKYQVDCIDEFNVKRKEYCIDEFNTNDVDTASNDRENEQAIALIQDPKQTIENLINAIQTFKAESQYIEVNQK